jgi:hypothetical protein
VTGEPERGSGPRRASHGLLDRHPRLAILVIGALFLLPICAMVVTVAVIILNQLQNAQ